MADQPLIGQGYSDYVGTRAVPGQAQTEYYNKQSGQAFATPDALASFLQPYSPGVNSGNVFDVLKAGYTPTAQALSGMKNDLSDFQEQLFNQPDPSAQRQSSSITDAITGENTNYNTLLQQYNDLLGKQKALQSPDYQQAYNDLRTQQGVPGMESDYLNTEQSIRDLPYTNRQSSGNAGVMTEGQLADDTTQKGIPLGIQEANILDRMKLASDFINNSMNFKELDANQSRQSLLDAINTAQGAISLSHTHLNDLLTQQQAEQSRQQVAQQFAYDNRISQPFYEIGGTVYRTSDRMPAHTPQEYQAMGGKGDFSDVQHVESPVAKNFGQIGSHVDSDGNVIPDYGFVNPVTGAVTPYNTASSPNTGGNSVGPTVSPTTSTASGAGIVNGYDLGAGIVMGPYANATGSDKTNYAYAAKVQSIADKVGTITDAASAQAAINSIKKNSPITGDMIMKAAAQYGVDPAVAIAVMQSETQLGTDGSKGAKGYNFGNVGNTNQLMASGGSKGFPTAQDGVNAVFANLAKRVVPNTQNTAATNAPTDKYYGLGKKTYDTVAPIVDKFTSEQTVQNFQAIADAQKTALGVTNPSNAAQSQALLFAYAKSLNPMTPSTRGGILDTLSSNSNSIVGQLGIDVNKIFNSASTLTPQAAQAMRTEIAQQYSQYKSGYDSLRNQYAQRIDNTAGTKGVGAKMLPDFSKQPGLDPAADYANQILTLSPEEQYANQLNQQINSGPASQFSQQSPVNINSALASGGLRLG